MREKNDGLIREDDSDHATRGPVPGSAGGRGTSPTCARATPGECRPRGPNAHNQTGATRARLIRTIARQRRTATSVFARTGAEAGSRAGRLALRGAPGFQPPAASGGGRNPARTKVPRRSTSISMWTGSGGSGSGLHHARRKSPWVATRRRRRSRREQDRLLAERRVAVRRPRAASGDRRRSGERRRAVTTPGDCGSRKHEGTRLAAMVAGNVGADSSDNRSPARRSPRSAWRSVRTLRCLGRREGAQ